PPNGNREPLLRYFGRSGFCICLHDKATHLIKRSIIDVHDIKHSIIIMCINRLTEPRDLDGVRNTTNPLYERILYLAFRRHASPDEESISYRITRSGDCINTNDCPSDAV